MGDAPSPTILDGGIGHELKLLGVSDGTFLAGVLANEEGSPNKHIVEGVHEDYLAAGCDVVTTNSFVAVPQRMVECGQASDAESANRRAAELIRASVDRARAAIANHPRKRIAGCIPPLTECYFSNKVAASIEDMMPEYDAILSTLLDCNVDILLAETLSTTREALAILRSLSGLRKREKQRPLPPIWISFTIHDNQHQTLRSGEMLETACRAVVQEASDLDVLLESIGVNCSTPSAVSGAVPMIANIAQKAGIGVSAYANCFRTTTTEWMDSLEGEDGNGKEGASAVAKQSSSRAEDYDGEGYLVPEAYARFAQQWVVSGATIVGGCCGSRPVHMEAVARTLRHPKG